MDDGEVLTSHNDREMILRPHLWGRVGSSRFLFLKKDPRVSLDRRSAVLLQPLNVYVAGEEKPRIYGSVDDLLADNWIVD